MTTIDKLLAAGPELQARFVRRAADPAVSGDMLLAEMRAAGVPAKRSAVFLWRRRYRSAKRHRPNSLAGRVASALCTATPATVASLNLAGGDTTAAVFKLGRYRLYAIAKKLGVAARSAAGASDVNDA